MQATFPDIRRNGRVIHQHYRRSYGNGEVTNVNRALGMATVKFDQDAKGERLVFCQHLTPEVLPTWQTPALRLVLPAAVVPPSREGEV